jgi:hypothetical protein
MPNRRATGNTSGRNKASKYKSRAKKPKKAVGIKSLASKYARYAKGGGKKKKTLGTSLASKYAAWKRKKP